MAVYGFGAHYGYDVSMDFIQNHVACIGWNNVDSPYLHENMKHIKIGDLVYLKKYVAPNLVILAAGIVVNNNFRKIDGLGHLCCDVEWIWNGERDLGKIDDKFTRYFTLYEEHNPELQKFIIDLLFKSKFSQYSIEGNA